MSLININKFREVPIKLLWSVVFLLFISLVILKSISNHYPDGFVYTPFLKQLIILVPAIIILLCFIFLPRYSIHKYAYILFLFGIIIVVLPFFGDTHAKTYRWLYIGLPFGIQTSEFAKVFTTLALARYLSDHTLKNEKI